MDCPKCKAKNGMTGEKLYVDSGAVTAARCYICGFWVQVHLPGAAPRRVAPAAA